MGLNRFSTGAVAIVLAAGAVTSANEGANAKAPAETTTIRARHDLVRLPNGDVVQLRDHTLEIRSGAVRATAPISAEASELQKIDLRPDGAMRLVFSRICPPPLTVDVAPGWTRARVMAGEAKEVAAKEPAQALVKLREALSIDPSQDDLRSEAARAALTAGRTDEALAVLQQGIRDRPAPTYWAVASDPSLESLKKDLLKPQSKPVFETDDDGATRTVLWAPERKWLAIADRLNPILLLTTSGEEVFAFPLTTGEDLNDSGDLLRGARKRVRGRLDAANDALAALGFQKLEGQWKDAEGPRASNRVTFAQKAPTVAIRDNVISLRRAGKPPIVAKLFNMGSLGIDWAFLPNKVELLVVSWSRVAGNDECPNGRGAVVFPAL